MESIKKVINSLSTSCENSILIGDFNATKSDTSIKDFCSFEKINKGVFLFQEPE